jgi:hypothetical protein
LAPETNRQMFKKIRFQMIANTKADYLKKYPDRLHITRPYFQVRGEELRNLAERVKDAYNQN